ncbi:sulfotransferase ssu-1-like [Ixodes scapularis]|uniref:sulfotransferase ssu-1-like n=1 Tax=Ixodes scapularis TaxID=6945 RepID=UPI001A9FBE88|nr:sulfotransferase ssu-1-like [Ixodes scapularis]
MPPQVYWLVECIRLSYYFRSDKVHTALAYKPQPDDVFIVSYLKCGATWVRQLLFAIFTDGAPPRGIFELLRSTPFLESSGAEDIKNMPRQRAISAHFGFGKHPYSKDSKYIYIARNPYDCCGSYYYHTKSFPAYFFQEGTFDEFFETFVGGQVEFGD